MNGAGADGLPVDVWLAIATILLCVALSAFFSASETALTAASRARMHALGEKWRPARGSGQPAAGEPGAADRRDACSATRSSISAPRRSRPASSSHSSATRGALYATGLMTVLLLVFAEVMPKTVAINYPDRTSLLVARVISFFVAIFGPILDRR